MSESVSVTPPEAVSPGRQRYVLFILTLIYMFNTMDRNVFSILAEPVRRELHLSDTQLGLLTGLAFALFYTFFGVPVGWIADRVGRVRVIVIACIVWSLCSASGGLATRFSHLALARMGVGIGEAGGAAPSYSLISAYFTPEKRGNALGIFHLASAAGMLVSSVVSAGVAVAYGWRTALVVISLPGVLFALVLLLTVKEPRQMQAAAAQPSLATSIKDYFRNPLLRMTAFVGGVSAFCSFGITAWLPTYLMRVKGMSLSEFAMYYGLPYAIFFGLGLWSAGYLADRVGQRSARGYALVPMFALLTTAPLIAVAVALPGWKWSFAGWLVPLMLAQMFLAPMLAIVQNSSPHNQRSTSSALYLFMNNLIGSGLGPLYVGTISDCAKPRFGDASLSVGLLAIIPVALIAAFGQWRIGVRLDRPNLTAHA